MAASDHPGRYETCCISGIALSPEFVYQVAPTDLLPDYQRYAVMWMNRRALGNAFGMDGAFNSVVASVQAGVRPPAVIEHMDRMLAPYRRYRRARPGRADVAPHAD
jgi:putative ABC transport system permease protein